MRSKSTVNVHTAPLCPVLEKANYCSENIDVRIMCWLLGKQRSDGICDTKTVDGRPAAFVHVFENCVTSDEI